MGFLDNSGDIILDAVITDTGRKRMAEGNFKITKFTLGDDEINYALYNYSHPSGSAYYDLEILQTPIFEALTNTSLNTGNISLTNLNILYMPDLLLNQKLSVAVKKKNNTIYVAVNSETYQKMNTQFGSRGFCLLAGSRSGERAIILESAVNNVAVNYTRTNLDTYIISTNMLDVSQTVAFDSNLIQYPITAASNSTWFTNATGDWAGALGTLQSRTTVSTANSDGFNVATAPMIRAAIFLPTGGATADITNNIESAGVIGSMNGINVEIPPELKTTSGQTADPRWAKFGTTGTPVGLSSNYSLLPTSIEVVGASSGATISIPLTLIKYDS